MKVASASHSASVKAFGSPFSIASHFEGVINPRSNAPIAFAMLS